MLSWENDRRGLRAGVPSVEYMFELQHGSWQEKTMRAIVKVISQFESGTE